MSSGRTVRSLRRRIRQGTRQAVDAAWLWLLALGAIWLILLSNRSPVSASTAVAGLLGLALVAVAARRPDRSLVLLILLLPFQGFLLARLWAWGMPTSLVRHLAAWKEALAVGVVVAGVRNFLATGRSADVLDRLALAFVGLVALYLVAQPAIVPGSPSAMSVRLLAFRQDAGFVLLLLGARHAPLPPGFLDRAGRAALLVATVVAGVCVFESVDSGGWNRFVVQTIGYPRYEIGVLHAHIPSFWDIRVYGTVGGTQIVRAGSVFLSPLTCGFYLVLGFALGLERSARGQAPPWVVPALVLTGAGILLTQTRSAILAALVVAFTAFQPAAGRRRHWRAQMAVVMIGLAILAVPAALSTGVVRRVEGASNNADKSSAGHVSAFWQGVHTIEHNPLGLGLGTSAGVGQRAQGAVVAENNYLQVGIELGVAPMVLFAVLTVTLVLSLRRAARRHPHAVVTAAWAAAAGLTVAAWFLQTWIDFSVAWTVWGLAGASVGAARVPAPVWRPAAAVVLRPDEQPVPA